MFALPLLNGESVIRLTSRLESAGYVDMTLKTLTRFGIKVIPAQNGWLIPGDQRYRTPGEYVCEGDWSNAAFFLVCGALAGDVAVSGLELDTAQGDSAVFEVLKRFGARAVWDGSSARVSPAPMKGIEIDASPIPDLVPALAVCACAAGGRTVIKNAARLRLKESDRLSAVSAALTALGGRVHELDDGLVIDGGTPLSSGVVDCANDHRIVMSMAAAAVMCRGPVVLKGASACEKSYPAFFDDYRMLGGVADVL